jgi:succinate dehydrogenase hydrophobic anchor subunit
MRKVLRDNGLSLALLVMFLGCLAAQGCFGHRAYNQEQLAHGRHGVELGEYLRGGHFWSATGENWESEFLQMFAYVLLTAWLYQKGSSESRKLEGENPQDRDPRLHRRRPQAPWPVRRGPGWLLRLYENSLAAAFLLLFLISIGLHAWGGLTEVNEERLEHGRTTLSMDEFLRGPQFWFESMQNWQSEFLALVAMVVLSIWLRQRHSPESKPVDAPHSETGAG